MSKQEVNKYTINITREERIRLLREEFIRMWLKKYMKENPEVKQELENKFQQLITEEFDKPVAQ